MPEFPHYKVETFRSAKALERRINQLYSDPPDNKQYYLYLLTESPAGAHRYTAVFAESRQKNA